MLSDVTLAMRTDVRFGRIKILYGKSSQPVWLACGIHVLAMDVKGGKADLAAHDEPDTVRCGRTLAAVDARPGRTLCRRRRHGRRLYSDRHVDRTPLGHGSSRHDLFASGPRGRSLVGLWPGHGCRARRGPRL